MRSLPFHGGLTSKDFKEPHQHHRTHCCNAVERHLVAEQLDKNHKVLLRFQWNTALHDVQNLNLLESAPEPAPELVGNGPEPLEPGAEPAPKPAPERALEPAPGSGTCSGSCSGTSAGTC